MSNQKNPLNQQLFQDIPGHSKESFDEVVQETLGVLHEAREYLLQNTSLIAAEQIVSLIEGTCSPEEQSYLEELLANNPLALEELGIAQQFACDLLSSCEEFEQTIQNELSHSRLTTEPADDRLQHDERLAALAVSRHTDVHDESEYAAQPSLQENLVFLTFQSPSGHQWKVSLKEGMHIIGASIACDLVLDDNEVSAIHAKLLFDSRAGLLLEDLDSTNGTFILHDGQPPRLLSKRELRLEEREQTVTLHIPHRLSDGESFQIGQHKCEVQIMGAHVSSTQVAVLTKFQ